MSNANSIETVFFQNADAAFFCIVVFTSAQYAVVMVDTAAPK